MNYLTEIKLFHFWLETHELTPAAILLWYGLMYLANKSGWEEELVLPMRRIEGVTYMNESRIYRARKLLCDAGILVVEERGSNRASVYTLLSFEDGSALQSALHNDTHFDTHNDTHDGSALHSELQSALQNEAENATHNASIYKHKPNMSSSKEKQKKEKKDKLEEWVSTVDSPWRELLRIWFEYKKARNETYKSEMSAKAFLTKLRNLSGDDPHTAQAIIEQSMASNWAGIFELKNIRPAGAPRTPATGQRIGQIIQPQSDAQRQALLDKFNKK